MCQAAEGGSGQSGPDPLSPLIQRQPDCSACPGAGRRADLLRFKAAREPTVRKQPEPTGCSAPLWLLLCQGVSGFPQPASRSLCLGSQ